MPSNKQHILYEHDSFSVTLSTNDVLLCLDNVLMLKMCVCVRVCLCAFFSREFLSLSCHARTQIEHAGRKAREQGYIFIRPSRQVPVKTMYSNETQQPTTYCLRLGMNYCRTNMFFCGMPKTAPWRLRRGVRGREEE